MPSFRLDPNDTRTLIAFIRSGFDSNTMTVPAGDATRGRAIFEGKGACLSCHRVDTRGRDIGPDLTDIGRARTPAAIQRSLVDPTGSMIPINRPVRAVTRDGRTITGRRLNEDTYTVQTPGEIRTPDHLVRSQVLYPTELRARACETPVEPAGPNREARMLAHLQNRD